MRPPEDVMERLAAADPLRDVERLNPEQQREADALLERLVATPAERERSPRRWPRLAAATAIAAVAVFAAFNLLDSEDGPAPNVVARAVAALTQKDVVYHVKLIASAHLSGSDMPEVDNTKQLSESWHTASGLVHTKAWAPSKDGHRSRRYDEFAGLRKPGRRGGYGLRYDPLTNTIMESGFGSSRGGGGAPGLDPFAPSRSLRELQAEGRLRSAGRVDIDGKPAYRLVSGDVPSRGGAIERTEFLVDAETYLPRLERLLIRNRDGSTARIAWRYLTYERLPLNAKTRALLDFDAHPGAKCSPFAGKNLRGPLGFPNPCAR